MASQSDNAVLYVAVYAEVDAAQADLEAFAGFAETHAIGDYDAAIIDTEDGKPHIVCRVDDPPIRVIPEWFGFGTLPRRVLQDVAKELQSGESAVIVVGEPTLEKAFEKAVTRADKTFKHDLNVGAAELERERIDAVKESPADGGSPVRPPTCGLRRDQPGSAPADNHHRL